MITHRSLGVSLVFAALGSGWSRGADGDPVAVLKAKGLAKAGVTFVVDAEKPVLTKIKEARAALAKAGGDLDRKDEADQASRNTAQLEERRVELQTQLDMLNQQINEQGFQQAGNMQRQGGNGFGQRGNGFGQGGMVNQLIAQRNQIRIPLDEIVAEQKAAKAAMPTDKKALDEQVKKSTEEAKASVAGLRPLIDEVVKTYTELGADPSVKAAIRALETKTKANFKLGPSDAFKAAVKALDTAERQVVGTRSPSAARKKGRSRR